ncbi:hypothetical protein FYK55_22650 [Roseiconus nitratireducens]|uniref:Uncharacterized protein n=1 Tax=Roseiconus nitratireducens TaxID=2605748 RepID=A0A5M6CXA2_9BACT|nr:hypothetical protein [Roseiconus nitratireducens]KAA5539854.1 hypothetical protein FYK55_22650 [Roseiconus nitratireducens]
MARRKTEVRFHAAVDLSVIHAAFVVATGGPCGDAKTEAALVGPTTEINTRLISASVDVRGFWSALFAAVAAKQAARDACEPALLAAGCSELQVDQTAPAIASRLDECRIAFAKRFPKLREQLQLRSGPLKDRWQTYGPGLLIQTAGQIWAAAPPDDWWPPRIDVLLVQPMRGGDGGFDSSEGRVWMEAMLTDADPQVSELFRLAYWITRVAVGRHLSATLGVPSEPSAPEDFGSGTHRVSSLPWDLGCVPVVLAAGHELEILRTDKLPIADAIRLWRLGDPAVGQVVDQWWQQWGDSKAPTPVALKALDRMLEPLRRAGEAAGGAARRGSANTTEHPRR